MDVGKPGPGDRLEKKRHCQGKNEWVKLYLMKLVRPLVIIEYANISKKKQTNKIILTSNNQCLRSASDNDQ